MISEKESLIVMKNDFINLSPSQLRYLRASLLIFEKSLRKSKRLLNEYNLEGFLFKRSNSLDTFQKNQILRKLDRALQKLESVVKKFGLEPREEHSEQTIIAEMSMSWANLNECQADHLNGYGKMDPVSAEKLDAEIKPLAEISDDIINLVENYLREKNGES